MSSSCCCHRSWYQVYSFQKRKSTITKHNSRALGLHEKVVEGIESQGLKATVFDKVVLLQKFEITFPPSRPPTCRYLRTLPRPLCRSWRSLCRAMEGTEWYFFHILGRLLVGRSVGWPNLGSSVKQRVGMKMCLGPGGGNIQRVKGVHILLPGHLILITWALSVGRGGWRELDGRRQSCSFSLRRHKTGCWWKPR